MGLIASNFELFYWQKQASLNKEYAVHDGVNVYISSVWQLSQSQFIPLKSNVQIHKTPP